MYLFIYEDFRTKFFLEIFIHNQSGQMYPFWLVKLKQIFPYNRHTLLFCITSESSQTKWNTLKKEAVHGTKSQKTIIWAK